MIAPGDVFSRANRGGVIGGASSMSVVAVEWVVVVGAVAQIAEEVKGEKEMIENLLPESTTRWA